MISEPTLLCNAFIFINVILCVPFVYCNPLVFDENLELELVQVLFRHGARTHIPCETEVLQINETSVHPWGFAQLTKEGMKQEYEIGQMLRERYNGFLPALYSHQHVYAFSSGTARSKASLELVLSALYPPVDEFVWNSKLNWMPLPILSIPNRLDILNKPRFCPKFIGLFNKLNNSTAWKKEALKHNDIRETLENTYGRGFNFSYIFCVYNAMFIQKNLNLPLPEWCNDETFGKLHDAAKFYLKTLSYNSDLQRLNGGTYARRLLENMNETNSSKSRKLYLYSSHDKNMHAVASIHNITLPRIPDYGSAIIVEMLRDEQGNRFVRILLWSGSPKKLETLKLNNCAKMCPLDEYIGIVTPMLPTDDDMLCLLKNVQPQDLERLLNSN